MNMSPIELVQIATLVFAIYNIYLSSLALKWMTGDVFKQLSKSKDEFWDRFIDKLKADMPMRFLVAIVISLTYISIGILITSGTMTTTPEHPSDFIIRAQNLLIQIYLVGQAQTALFAEQCHKKRVALPFTKFRFTLPVYQNKNKEYF